MDLSLERDSSEATVSTNDSMIGYHHRRPTHHEIVTALVLPCRRDRKGERRIEKVKRHRNFNPTIIQIRFTLLFLICISRFVSRHVSEDAASLVEELVISMTWIAWGVARRAHMRALIRARTVCILVYYAISQSHVPSRCMNFANCTRRASDWKNHYLHTICTSQW